jgi:UDP-N-acetylglucosamine 2-epimerase (non-hydrolysing)
MRLLVVMGTRPEAIKLAPVVRELRRRPDAEVRVCLTGQHQRMVEQVARFFDLAADHDLAIMTPDQTLSDVTARTLRGIAPVLDGFSPEWVIVQGDTTTAFAAALAAFYRKIKVAHVEAGLRSGDKYSPYPEEMNRVLITHLGDLHLAPTRRAAEALLRENVPRERVHVVGNTVVDALREGISRIESQGLGESFAGLVPGLRPDRPLLLVTGHRRESFGAPFEQICRALHDIAAGDDVEVVYPVHLNPNVRRPVF